MKAFRTIIIGAGPGGLACAKMLARNGQEVLVLEKKERVGPKICAGGITWSGLRRLIPDGFEEAAFPTQHVFSPRRQVIIAEQDPIVATVDRQRLGQWMLKEAMDAGAEVRTGTRVEKISEDHLVASGHRFHFQHLVGADGAASLVRRFLKIPTKKIGVGIQFWLDGQYSDMEWHLDRHFFGCGYGWIFPHKNKISIGAYAGRNGLPARRLQEGLERWMKIRGWPLKGLQPEAATINFDFRGWNFGRFLLVGDAAGLASPLTGEGIYPAVISGEAAALAIMGQSSDNQSLIRLLKKHRRHLFFQQIAAHSAIMNGFLTGFLTLALKIGFVGFQSLEMGEERKKGD
jgi:geranylgeranyl reductase family protein